MQKRTSKLKMTEKKIVIDSTRKGFFHPLFSGRHNYYIGNGVLTKEGFIYRRREIREEDDKINVCLIKKERDGESWAPTKKQWEGLVSFVAGNCRRFEIPVSFACVNFIGLIISAL